MRSAAGGYRIQGLGASFVLKVEGSVSNVIGLPVAALCKILLNFLEQFDSA